MMFGGDPSSVLFNEVREKQSLAYSIHSQIDGKNGFLFVLSGVFNKYEIAKDTILDEFEKLKNGNFDDGKLELQRKLLSLTDMNLLTDLKVLSNYYIIRCY